MRLEFSNDRRIDDFAQRVAVRVQTVRKHPKNAPSFLIGRIERFNKDGLHPHRVVGLLEQRFLLLRLRHQESAQCIEQKTRIRGVGSVEFDPPVSKLNDGEKLLWRHLSIRTAQVVNYFFHRLDNITTGATAIQLHMQQRIALLWLAAC